MNPVMDWKELPVVVTAEEAADLLRIHPNTLKSLLDSGELVGVKVGRAWRVSRDALKTYLETPQANAPGDPIAHALELLQDATADDAEVLLDDNQEALYGVSVAVAYAEGRAVAMLTHKDRGILAMTTQWQVTDDDGTPSDEPTPYITAYLEGVTVTFDLLSGDTITATSTNDNFLGFAELVGLIEPDEDTGDDETEADED